MGPNYGFGTGAVSGNEARVSILKDLISMIAMSSSSSLAGPQYPENLEQKVELWIGEGEEAEKYIITKTCVFLMPAGVLHNPTWVRSVITFWLYPNRYDSLFTETNTESSLPPSKVAGLEETRDCY
jgi:hypothetical protein